MILPFNFQLCIKILFSTTISYPKLFTVFIAIYKYRRIFCCIPHNFFFHPDLSFRTLCVRFCQYHLYFHRTALLEPRRQ